MDKVRREVRRVVALVTELIARPVMDMGQVAAEVIKYGVLLTYDEKVIAVAEICRRFGV